jgi:hypothetical protein
MLTQMKIAAKRGAADILITSDDLCLTLGGRWGRSESMPACCRAMKSEMRPGDALLADSSDGAGMTIRFQLPRAPV